MDNSLKSQQEEYKKKLKFNENLTRAKACFINKDYVSSSEFLQKALEINPKDLEARELAADILCLNGKMKEAGREYKAIYDADNTRVQAEEKFAKTVLSIYNSEEKVRQMEKMLHGESVSDEKKNVYTIFLGAIIPGLGRIMYEHYMYGIIIFMGYLVFMGMSINQLDLSRDGVLSLFTSASSIIANIIWVYSFIDTISLYNKNKGK